MNYKVSHDNPQKRDLKKLLVPQRSKQMKIIWKSYGELDKNSPCIHSTTWQIRELRPKEISPEQGHKTKQQSQN